MNTFYLDKVASLLREQGFDALLVSPSAELKFLTGVSPMMCERFQGLFLLKTGRLFYICNHLYTDEMTALLGDEVPVYGWYDWEDMPARVMEYLAREGLPRGARIGVNSSAQAFNVLELMARGGYAFCSAVPLLEEARIRKTPQELQLLRESARLADSLFPELLDFLQVGQRESDVRDFLFGRMQAQGGTDPWCIVGSGPNSSYPHYCSYDRVLQAGDALVLDYGCALNGLQSDMTRTVFLGSVTDEQREIYELVCRSNRAGEQAAREGAWIPDIDRAARGVLAGYAETLTTRLGHGVGYMVHEGPYIKQSNPRRLERGMVFSIEPGVYLKGRFGVRVEDLVAISEQGETEILNRAPHDLFVVG